MGRRATVASGNVWYEARLQAAKGNERLSSRAGAAEAAGMSEDAIKDTELGLEKHMPVEKAVILADVYGEPSLLNHYCLNECPIGCRQSISCESLSIEQVTVKLIKRLRVDQLDEIRDRLVDIADDGKITDDEVEDLKGIVGYLDGLSKTISELKLIGEKIAARREK